MKRKWIFQLGMLVDVAHASHATISDVLAMAQRPVISSHGGVKATSAVILPATPLAAPDQLEFRAIAVKVRRTTATRAGPPSPA